MWNIIFWIASFVLSQYLQSLQKQEDAKPAGKFDFPTATEGRVIPLIRGTMKLAGPNVTWYGDYKKIPITKSTGGMFSDDVTVGFSYYFGMMMGLCLGTVTKITRIWVDEKLLWSGEARNNDVLIIDQEGFFGGPETGAGGLRGHLRIHTGAMDQEVDPYLTTQFGESKTPAYRGLAYVVWEGPSDGNMYDPKRADLQAGVHVADQSGKDIFKIGAGLALGLYNLFHRPRRIGYLGTQSQIAPWAFEVQCIPNPLGLGVSYGNGSVNTYDYNPAAFLYEIMTTPSWGLGRSEADIEVSTFVTAAHDLFLEGNGVSISFDTATPAKDIIGLVEEQIDGKVVLNPQTGKWELRLIRQLTAPEYDPTKELNSGNILEMNNVARGSWDGTVNHVAIEYNDRAKEYMTTYAPAHDLGNLRIQEGRVVTANLRYPGVKTAGLASALSWRELRVRAIPLLKCEIVVDRTMWDVLPCDVVYLYDSKRKIQFTGNKTPFGGTTPVGLPMRVIKVDWGQLADGKITLSVVQDVYFTQMQTSAFASTSGNSWDAPTTTMSAFDLTDLLYFETPYAIVRRSKLSEGNYPWMGAVYKDDCSVSSVPLYLNAEGAYVSSNELRRFVRRGVLRNDLGPNDTEFTITADGEDSVGEMVQSLPSATVADIGNNLANLVMIGSEFLAPTSAVSMVDYVRCSGAYRGLMDSCPATHTAGDTIWIIGAAGGVVNAAYDIGDTAHVKLVPRNMSEFGDAEEALDLPLAIQGRKDLPYPPNKLLLGGTAFPASVDIVGGDLTATWYRRDRTVLNEIENLSADQGADADVAYQLEWYEDVGGGGNWVLRYRHPWTPNGTWTLTHANVETLFGAGPKTTKVRAMIRTERLFPVTIVSGILSHDFTLNWT